MTVAIVCGITEEANILNSPPGAIVVMSDGSVDTLTDRLGAAIAMGADSVLVFEVCGALDPALKAGQVVVGSEIVVAAPGNVAQMSFEPNWSQSLAIATGGVLVKMTGASATVTTAATKAALRDETGARAVNLDVGTAFAMAVAHGIPCAYLGAVSDTYDQDIPAAAIAGMTSGETMIRSLISDPGQLAELGAIYSTSALAFGALSLALANVGLSFGR